VQFSENNIIKAPEVDRKVAQQGNKQDKIKI